MDNLLGTLVSTKEESYNHAMLPVYALSWASIYRGTIITTLDENIEYFAQQYGSMDDETVASTLEIGLPLMNRYVKPVKVYDQLAFVLAHAHHAEAGSELINWLKETIQTIVSQPDDDDSRVINTIQDVVLDFLSTPYELTLDMFHDMAKPNQLNTIQIENCRQYIDLASQHEVALTVGIIIRTIFSTSVFNLLKAYNVSKQHIVALSVEMPEDGAESMCQLMHLIGESLTHLRSTYMTKSKKTLEFVLRSTSEYFQCGATDTILSAYQCLDEEQKTMIIERWYRSMKPIIIPLKEYVNLADEYDDQFQRGEIDAPTEVQTIRLELMTDLKELFMTIEHRLPDIVKDLDIAGKIEHLSSLGDFFNNVECKSYIRMLHALNVHALRYHQHTQYNSLELKLVNTKPDDIEDPNEVSGFFTAFVKSCIQKMKTSNQRTIVWTIGLLVKQMICAVLGDYFLENNRDFTPDMIYRSSDIIKGLQLMSQYVNEYLGVDFTEGIMLSDDEQSLEGVSEDMTVDADQDVAF